MSSQRPALIADRGSVTAWMALVPLLVAVLGGFSLDLWAGIDTRGRIAAIADDAAAAGATALSDAGVRAAVQVTSLDLVAAQDRALAAVDAHPDVRLIDARSAHATADVVSVTVEGRHQFLLLRLLGVRSTPIVVTGHAAPITLG